MVAKAKRFIAEDVKVALLVERESDEPDALLPVFKAHEGKKYNVHFLRKLPGGEERWRLYRIAGMTYVEETKYRQSEGNRGISLLVSYDTSGPHVIDAAWVEEKNAAWYSARRERNALRDACLADPKALADMAEKLTLVATAKEAFEIAKKNLDMVTSYGKPFSPDNFDWERMCGAREEEKRR